MSPPLALTRKSASKSTLLLEELKKEHRTILMTTHYIEEAERLCDRVAIVDEGKIIALDTPSRLQQQSRNASSIVVTCAKPFPADRPAWAEATQSVLDVNWPHVDRTLPPPRCDPGRSGEMD